MKKIILSVALVTALITASKAQDKAFKKGDITVDLGVGFDLYKTRLHQEIAGAKHDTIDGAGGAHFPLKAEYGVTNWLGIGARFNFSSFVDDPETSTHTKATTRGIDAGIVANFHLVKAKHFDMPLSLTFGYSYLGIRSNNGNDDRARGNGTSFGIGLLPRFYFGEHVGIYLNIGYMAYNYPNIIYSDKDESNLNDLWDAKVSLKASGVNLGIGLIGKF